MLIAVLIVAGAAGGVGYHLFGPTREKADIGALYGASGEDGVVIYLDYDREPVEGCYREGTFYLPYRWVLRNLNDRFYYDEESQSVLYTYPEEVYSFGSDTLGEMGRKMVLFGEAGLPYENGSMENIWLSQELVENFTNARFLAVDEEGARRIFVQTKPEEVRAEITKKNTALRVRGGRRSNVQTLCAKGEKVAVLEEFENWTEVVSEHGFRGYVPKKALTEPVEETMPVTYEEPVYNPGKDEGKLTLAWHQITNTIGNDTFDSFTKDTKGIRVISPTWFVLNDNDGSFISFSSQNYVQKAHAAGMQVWAVLDNFSNPVSEQVQTEVVLSKASARSRIITGLLEEAEKVGFDGINLDFEGLKEEAGVHYVQFIRELSIACRAKGLTLSVDNYVPAPYNDFYNLKEQGVMVDYVIIMAYDEHFTGSDAGSVSSLGYVRDGIKHTLADVPAEKVICGLPVYTRLWTVNGGTTTSKAIGMAAAADWVNKNGVELKWLDETGQYYAEKDASDGVKKMWLEDEKSLKLKMDVVREQDLAGVAMWKLNMEQPVVWDIFAW